MTSISPAHLHTYTHIYIPQEIVGEIAGIGGGGGGSAENASLLASPDIENHHLRW